MKFFPSTQANYDDLTLAFAQAKFDFTQLPHSGHYEAGQRAIDAAGVALVDYERRIGIDKARKLLTQERELSDRIAVFEQNLADYKFSNEERNTLINAFANGQLDVSQIHKHAESLKDWSTAVQLAEDVLTKLRLMLAQVKSEKAKLAHIALQDCQKPDPLSRDERRVFEAFQTQQNALPVALGA